MLLNNNSEASLQDEPDNQSNAQDNYYIPGQGNNTDNLLKKNMITPVQHRHIIQRQGGSISPGAMQQRNQLNGIESQLLKKQYQIQQLELQQKRLEKQKRMAL